MNKEQREKYLDLINLTSYGLCNFCKYSKWSGYCSSEAELECQHPLDAINGFDNEEHPGNVWSGDDCWGYRPNNTLQAISVFVGIILEGNMPHYSRNGELVAIIPSQRDKEYGLV